MSSSSSSDSSFFSSFLAAGASAGAAPPAGAAPAAGAAPTPEPTVVISSFRLADSRACTEREREVEIRPLITGEVIADLP